MQEILIRYREKHYHCEGGQTLEQQLINFVAKGCILGEIQNSAGEGPEQADWTVHALSGGLDQMTSRGQLQSASCNGSDTAWSVGTCVWYWF